MSKTWKNHGVLNMDFGNGFKMWLAFKKNKGKWKITLDEGPILQKLTKGWKQYKFGKLTYISNYEFSEKDNVNAQKC